MNQSIRTVPDFSICQFAFGNLFFFCWLTSELIYSSVISVHDRPCLSIWTFVRLSITKKKNRQSRMIVYGPPFWTIVTPPPSEKSRTRPPTRRSDVLSLPLDHRIGHHVAHVDLEGLGPEVRMLLHEQPSDVREEKPAGRVVRVGVRVGALVVDAVVADPLEHVELVGERLERDQQHAQGQTGLERPVGPQPMGAGGYAQDGAAKQRGR